MTLAFGLIANQAHFRLPMLFPYNNGILTAGEDIFNVLFQTDGSGVWRKLACFYRFNINDGSRRLPNNALWKTSAY